MARSGGHETPSCDCERCEDPATSAAGNSFLALRLLAVTARTNKHAAEKRAGAPRRRLYGFLLDASVAVIC